MLAASHLGRGPNVFTTSASTSSCVALERARGAALAKVIVGIARAEAAISAKAVTAKLFTQLAQDSRALGDATGAVKACKAAAPSPADVPRLRQRRASTVTALVLAEASLSKAWADRQWRTWMRARASIQSLRADVTELDGRLAKVVPSAPRLPGTQGGRDGQSLPGTSVSPVGPVDLPVGPTTPATAADAIVDTGTAPGPMTPDVVDPEAARRRKLWLWGGLASAGLVAFAVLRRR